jgi:tetratricopeptide (TPR) repeat protein
VFFDIETTGLSGGAGTLAFLVGCGWFEADGSFIVRQFFLAGPSGERAMLTELARVFDNASLVVTYNGRTFDVPFMETRWAFHRTQAPTEDLPHFDMLPPARRLWGRRDLARPDTDGCSLSALERRVLGFHRFNDVPGFEIPGRYFQFLRTGATDLIEGVLEHNRHDLVSLAAVMSQALWMVHEGPAACRDAAEQLAVAQIYERAGLLDRAADAYERVVACGDATVQQPAWARLAFMHRRARRYDDAAAAWKRVLDLVPRGRRVLSSLERQAVEALAIHHEHRARDLDRARGYAEALDATTTGRRRVETEKRLQRLGRKLRGRERGRNGTLSYEPDEP